MHSGSCMPSPITGDGSSIPSEQGNDSLDGGVLVNSSSLEDSIQKGPEKKDRKS